MIYSPLNAWIGEKTGLGEGMTPGELREWQFMRLRETLRLVKRCSKQYAETLKGIEPEAIRGPADLRRLPFTTEADLRGGGTRFVCVPQSEVARIMTLDTSGTRGEPKRVYFSEADQEACVDFFATGMLAMVEPGDRVQTFLGPLTPGNTVDLLRRGLERVGISTLVCAGAEDPAGPAAVECLVGLPVRLFRMAKLAPGLRPKSALLCADYVPQAIREAIRETWRCAVFTHYGSTESGLGGGVECGGHSGLHLRDADLLFEIVDPASGLPVPDNTPGEVVFSTLNRSAMPLIRYRTGDLARMLDAPCACGSPLRRLDAVAGRSAGRIALKSGGELSIGRLDEAFFSQPEALDYAAELEADGGLRIAAEVLGTVEPGHLARRIGAALDLDLPVSVTIAHTPLPALFAKRSIKTA